MYLGACCPYSSVGILPVLCAIEAHSVLVVYCQCCSFCGKTVPREPRSLNSVDWFCHRAQQSIFQFSESGQSQHANVQRGKQPKR